MSDDRLTLTSRELRQAFDGSFAAPPARPEEDLHSVLAVRVAGVGYALRTAEIAGVVATRRIVRLPSPQPALLGLAGLRAGLLPVYSLAILLGHGGDGDPPRWLALSGTGGEVGLAFQELEAQLHLPGSAFHGAGASEGLGRHVREVARFAGSVRPVVSIVSVMEAIRAPVRPGGTEEG